MVFTLSPNITVVRLVFPLNRAGIVVSFGLKYTFSILGQFSKTLLYECMLFTPFPMLTIRSFSQLAKILLSRYANESGKAMLSRLLQPMKASGLIAFKFLGKIISFKFAHPANVLLPIVFKESGKVICSNAAHPLKVPFNSLNPFPKVIFANLAFPLN